MYIAKIVSSELEFFICDRDHVKVENCDGVSVLFFALRSSCRVFLVFCFKLCLVQGIKDIYTYSY